MNNYQNTVKRFVKYNLNLWFFTALLLSLLALPKLAVGQCAAGAKQYVMRVQIDSFPQQFSWAIKDSATGVILDTAAPGSYFSPGVYTDTVCLSDGVTYTLSTWDSFGNGWNGTFSFYRACDDLTYVRLRPDNGSDQNGTMDLESSFSFKPIKFNCLCLNPQSGRIKVLSSSEIRLNWSRPGTFASEFEVAYGPIGSQPANAVFRDTVTTTNYTFRNLNSGTNYQLFLKSLCGITTSGVLTGSVSTFCGKALSLPFVEDFENIPANRVTGNSANSRKILSCDSTATFYYEGDFVAQAKIGSRTPDAVGLGALTLDTWGSSIADRKNTVDMVLDLSNYSNASNLELFFDIKGHNEDFDRGDAFFISGSYLNSRVKVTTFSNINTPSFTTLGPFDLDSILSANNQSVSTSTTLRFTQTGNYPYPNDGITIDNIVIQQTPSCRKPTGLSESNISDNAVTVDWTENNNATSWELAGLEKGQNFSQAITTIASIKPFTLPGLQSNTEYQWYVRSICAPGDTSAWSSVGEFTTECDAVAAPYTQNFSNVAIDNCWDTLTVSSGVQGEVRTNLNSDFPGASPGRSVVFNVDYSNSGFLYLITPRFSDLATDKQVRFKLLNPNNGTLGDLILGTMSDPIDETTFRALDTIPDDSLSGSWREFVRALTFVPAGHEHLAFKYTYHSAVNDELWLDDFRYENIPSCDPPTNLTETNITINAVDMDWTDNASPAPTQWEVSYGTGITVASAGQKLIAHQKPFTLSGLTHNTSYNWFIRAVCNGDSSNWVQGNTFTTLFDCNFGALADLGPDTIINFPDTVTLVNRGRGSNFSWSSGASTAQIKVAPADTQTYALTVTDANGCSSTDSVTVNVRPRPTLRYLTDSEFNGNGVAPQNGTTANIYEYKVEYSHPNNVPPLPGHPVLFLDSTGNGSYNDPGDYVISMREEDPNDTNYRDGKVYTYFREYNSPLFLAKHAYNALDTFFSPAKGLLLQPAPGPFVNNDSLDLYLYANDILFSDDRPDENDTVQISARIRNFSRFDAQQVNVRIYREDTLIHQETVARIASNTVHFVRIKHVFSATQYYPIKVVIDEADNIQEDNELNNFAIRGLIVGRFSVPAGINVTGFATDGCEGGSALFIGRADYFNVFDPNTAVSGAEVTVEILNPNGANPTYIGRTISTGVFKVPFRLPIDEDSLSIRVTVTDFTLTGTTTDIARVRECVDTVYISDPPSGSSSVPPPPGFFPVGDPPPIFRTFNHNLRTFSEQIAPTEINPDTNEYIQVFGSFTNGNPQFIDAPFCPNLTTARDFYVRFLVNSKPLGDPIYIDQLGPYMSKTVMAPDSFATNQVGGHVIRLVLDTANAVQECFEFDNEASRAIIVGDAPDFSFSVANGLALSNSSPQLGEAVDIDFDISNFGGLAGQGNIKIFTISALSDTSIVDSIPISVPSVDSNKASYTWVATQTNGQLYFTIEDVTPLEVNRGNNSIIKDLGQEPPVVTKAPVSQIACLNSNLLLTAAGDDVSSFQWQKDGTDVSGATDDSLRLNSLQLSDNGRYRVIVSNSFSSDTSDEAVIGVPSLNTGFDTVSACLRYSFAGNTYTSSGDYVDTISTARGCDSIVKLNLTINSISRNTISDTACGLYVTPSGRFTHNQSGTYIDTLVNAVGCDSVLTIQLTVLATDTISRSISICSNDSLLAGGDWRNITGMYTDNFTKTNGCDSVVITNLTVKPAYETPLNRTICSNDSVLLEGAWRSTSGVYRDTAIALNGCDSVTVTTLTVNRAYDTTKSQFVCAGDSVELDGLWRKQSGTYSELFTTGWGCDSLVTTVLNLLPEYVDTLTREVCSGDSLNIAGQWRSSPGFYRHFLTAGNGCDSTVVTHLKLLPEYNVNIPLTLCQGDSILLAGAYRKTAGNYSDTLASGRGCDSIVQYTLSIPVTQTSNRNLTICHEDSVFFGARYLRRSGFYINTLTDLQGCDSLATLNLTVRSRDTARVNYFVCAGDSLQIGNIWRQTPGIYYQNLTGSNGCDSVVAHRLRQRPVYNINRSITICNRDSIFLNGAWRNTSGTYTDRLTSMDGCDSIIRTNLNVQSQLFAVFNRRICSGDSLFLEGAYRKKAGVYIDEYATPGGCDSTVFTNLSVVPDIRSSDSLTLCPGDSAFLEGRWRKTPGLYQDTLSGLAGSCDSIVSTHLKVVNIDTAVNYNNNLLSVTPYLNATYQWFNCDDGQPIDGATSPVYRPVENGAYACVIDKERCSLSTGCNEVNDIGLSELVFSQLEYYPNPVRSNLTIDLGERFEVLKISVVDASGREVLKDIYLKKQKIELDLSGLSKGVYYVSLQGNGAVHNLKISKD